MPRNVAGIEREVFGVTIRVSDGKLADIAAKIATHPQRVVLCCLTCEEPCLLPNVCSCCERAAQRGAHDPKNPHRPLMSAEELATLRKAVPVVRGDVASTHRAPAHRG